MVFRLALRTIVDRSRIPTQQHKALDPNVFFLCIFFSGFISALFGASTQRISNTFHSDGVLSSVHFSFLWLCGFCVEFFSCLWRHKQKEQIYCFLCFLLIWVDCEYFFIHLLDIYLPTYSYNYSTFYMECLRIFLVVWVLSAKQANRKAGKLTQQYYDMNIWFVWYLMRQTTSHRLLEIKYPSSYSFFLFCDCLFLFFISVCEIILLSCMVCTFLMLFFPSGLKNVHRKVGPSKCLQEKDPNLFK